MDEVGTIRPRDNGRGYEYLAQQGMSTRRGYWEVWEPVGEHAIKHMPLPDNFRSALTAAGASPGTTLHDLLIAEGWTPPGSGYIEQQPSSELTLRHGRGAGPGALPPVAG